MVQGPLGHYVYVVFPKDSYGTFFRSGQRHKWASFIVWLDNPSLEKPKILAVSTSFQTGEYQILKNGPPACGRRSCSPPFTDYINGTSAMLAYLDTFYGSILEMTTARTGGELQDLIMWEQLTEEAQIALNETDFGEKARVPFIDANLNANLEQTRSFL